MAPIRPCWTKWSTRTERRLPATGSPVLGGLADDVAVAAVAESVAYFGGRRPVIFHSCCSSTSWGVFREGGSAASTVETGLVRTFLGHFHQALTFQLSNLFNFFLCNLDNFRLHFASPERNLFFLPSPPLPLVGRVVHFFFSWITVFFLAFLHLLP